MNNISRRFKHFVDHPFPEMLESNSQAGQDLFVVAMLQGKKQGTFLEIGAGNLQYGSNTFLLEKEFDFSGTSIDIENYHSEKHWQREIKIWWRSFYNDIKDVTWPSIPGSINDLPIDIQRECREKHGYDDYFPKLKTWENDRPRTKFVQGNALEIDYSFLDPTIDYLQIDIDPPQGNLKVLEKVLHHSKFSVITFEHDLWRSTDAAKYVREKSRQLLDTQGYIMIANDITVEPDRVRLASDRPLFFEDWYVHPDFVGNDVIECYSCMTHELRPKYFSEVLFADNYTGK